MAGRTIHVGDNIRIVLNNEEFERVRKAPKLHALFSVRGHTWESRLNAELHTAQAKRKQPVEDGYTHHITTGGSRLRMYVVAATARAQAHERAHSSILKLMETTQYDVQTRVALEKKAAKATAKAKRKAARQRRRDAEKNFVDEGVQGIKTGMSVFRASSPDTRGDR